MRGVNKVIIMGRLGSDPEVKTVGSGRTVCKVSVATSETWNGADGAKNERTEWHRVVLWGKKAEICGEYLKKGSAVYFEGKLQTRKWTDQKGETRYSTEIVADVMQFMPSSVKKSDSYVEGTPLDNGQDFGPEPSFDPNDEIPF